MEQTIQDIVNFLKKNVEPLSNSAYGPGYRAAVYLTDGTHLPCVIFRNPDTILNLALKRFTKKSPTGWLQSFKPDPHIVKAFVTQGNRLSEDDIKSIKITDLLFRYIYNDKFRAKLPWVGQVLLLE